MNHILWHKAWGFLKKRPKSSWSDILTALATCIGLFSIVHALRNEAAADAEDCISKLYPLDLQLNTGLANFPNARRAFDSDVDGKVFVNLDEANLSEFIVACEAFGDELEYYLLIRDRIVNYPNGQDVARSWDEYFKSACANSYGFRSRVNSERPIWTTNFVGFFDNYSGGLPYLTNFSTVYGKFPTGAPVPSQKH